MSRCVWLHGSIHSGKDSNASKDYESCVSFGGETHDGFRSLLEKIIVCDWKIGCLLKIL